MFHKLKILIAMIEMLVIMFTAGEANTPVDNNENHTSTTPTTFYDFPIMQQTRPNNSNIDVEWTEPIQSTESANTTDSSETVDDSSNSLDGDTIKSESDAELNTDSDNPSVDVDEDDDSQNINNDHLENDDNDVICENSPSYENANKQDQNLNNESTNQDTDTVIIPDNSKDNEENVDIDVPQHNEPAPNESDMKQETQLPEDNDDPMTSDGSDNESEKEKENEDESEITGSNESHDMPQECTSHDLMLVETKIHTSYELYNYVSDAYKCRYCDYTSTKIHAANANLTTNAIQTAEANIVACVNELRVKNGLNVLSTDDAWDSWASLRAEELAEVYGHRRPDGSDWAYAIGNQYTGGENVAFGQTSSRNFYIAFYNSMSHRDTMLIEDAVGIAVGIYVDENGTPYCAMVLICEF